MRGAGKIKYNLSMHNSLFKFVFPSPLHPPSCILPMISALDRKLLRDLSQMKGQSFAIAIVIAAGVATFVNSRTILHSLELTRSTFYERYRFADVFAKREAGARRDRPIGWPRFRAWPRWKRGSWSW